MSRIDGCLQAIHDHSHISSNLAAAQALDPATPMSTGAVPYNKSSVLTKSVNQWLNPHMFTLPQASATASGYMGNTQRGLMRGPGQVNWDFSMVKNTKIGWMGDKGNFQFRAEVFNILNHTNFAFPYSNNYNANYQAIVSAGSGVDGSDISPTAGQITNTLINARQIQFAAKFEF